VGKIAGGDYIITTAAAGDFAHPTYSAGMAVKANSPYESPFRTAYTCSGPGNLRLLTSAA
jgi:hypothetical protein